MISSIHRRVPPAGHAFDVSGRCLRAYGIAMWGLRLRSGSIACASGGQNMVAGACAWGPRDMGTLLPSASSFAGKHG